MKPDIILCHPQHDGNIGFSARSMKTMGFTRLVIITKRQIDMNAAKITSTAAKDVLENAKLCTQLSDILPQYRFLVAFTARKRRFRNQISLPELPALIHQTAGRAGLVFGRENSGLTNREIQSCQCVVTIPSSRIFSSLNLSHAVQIACYELTRKVVPGRKGGRTGLATAMERETIFEKLEKACTRIGLRSQEMGKISTIFRILFEERALEKREAGAIHRFLDQIIHHE